MISSSFDFQEFAQAVKGKDFHEIIFVAEKEATEAWRTTYHSTVSEVNMQKSQQYQRRLIGLIDYIRNGVHPTGQESLLYKAVLEGEVFSKG